MLKRQSEQYSTIAQYMLSGRSTDFAKSTYDHFYDGIVQSNTKLVGCKCTKFLHSKMKQYLFLFGEKLTGLICKTRDLNLIACIPNSYHQNGVVSLTTFQNKSSNTRKLYIWFTYIALIPPRLTVILFKSFRVVRNGIRKWTLRRNSNESIFIFIQTERLARLRET